MIPVTTPCIHGVVSRFSLRSLISLRGVPLSTSNMTLFYSDSGFCFESPCCSGYPRLQHSQALSLAEKKNLAETTSAVLSSNDEKDKRCAALKKQPGFYRE